MRNLQLAITYECQYGCWFCAARKFKREGVILGIDDIKRIVKEVKDLGCIHINLTGGEPLLHPKLNEIVKVISGERILVSLITNGNLLDKNKALVLRKSGLNGIAVSLYGDEETHDKTTGVIGSYQKCIQAIEVAKKNHLNVIINTVISREFITKNRIESIKKIARTFNVLIQPIPLCFSNRDTIIKKEDLKEEDLGEFHKLIENHFIRPRRHYNYFGSHCPAGKEHFYISAYGDAMMCDLVEICVGNILKEPLGRIWERMLEQKKNMDKEFICLGVQGCFSKIFK